MSIRSIAVLVVAILLALPASAKERTWTSADGRTMKAEFVREVDGVVTFLKEGRLVTIPLERLSEKDQQLIRDVALGKPLPDEEEPTTPTPNPSATPAGSSTPPANSQADSQPPTPRITISARTWTDNRGIKTTAKFVRINGTDVVLNRAGRILTVSFYTLSADDQQYVRDVLTQEGKEALIPPERTAPVAGGSPAGIGSDPVAGGTGPGPFPGGAAPVGPGIGPGGIPGGPVGGGFPGGGFPGGGFPGAGGLPGPGAIPGPQDVPMPGPADIPMPVPTIDPPLGVGPGLSDPALPGSSLPGAGNSGGYGPGSSIPTSIPPSIPQSRFPRHPTSPSFPTGPTFEQVFQCSGCKRQISQDQSKLDRCPYCNTIWVYKEDGSGRKQVTSGGVRNMVVGAIVGVVIVVLGGVAGFIGIIVAIVRAVSRPARNSYRRY